MNSKQRIGLAVGGGIIAIGAAVGVGAFAASLANGSSGDQAVPAGAGQQQQSGRSGNRGGGQFDTTAMAKQLATKLGVDEAKLKTALDNALKANQPSGAPSAMPGGSRPSGAAPSGAPSAGAPSGAPGGNDTRRTERLTAMAASIATELNLDQAKVLAALQEVIGSQGGGQPSGQPSSQPTR